MSWRRLWFRLIRRTFGMYLGYVLVVALSVAIFSMTHALLTTMQTTLAAYANKARMSSPMVTNLLLVLLVIVFTFAFFFIIYFHRLLLRRESPALGLLSTLGMAPAARRTLVWWESAWLGGIGILAGLGIGLVLSPLFALAASVLLHLPTRLHVTLGFSTIGLTLIAFAILVGAEGVISAWLMGRRWPRQLFAARYAAAPVTRPSYRRAVLGIVCLAVGYGVAILHPHLLRIVSPSTAVILWPLAMPIITVAVCLGSYWLIGETLRWWLFRRHLMGSTVTSLLARARLAARLRDHANTGTLIAALLAAIVAPASGIVSIQVQALTHIVKQSPIVIQLAASQEHTAELEMATTQIAERLRVAGFGPITTVHVPVALAAVPLEGVGERGLEPYSAASPQYWDFSRIKGVNVLSWSDYQALRAAIVQTHPSLATQLPTVPALTSGSAFVLRQGEQKPIGSTPDTMWLLPGRTYTVLPINLYTTEPASMATLPATLPRFTLTLAQSTSIDGNVIDIGLTSLYQTVFVVDDTTFAAMYQAAATQQSTTVITGLFYPNWKGSGRAVMNAIEILPSYEGVAITPLPIGYDEVQGYVSGLLFTLALFALLALLAMGATVTLKIGERAEADVHQVAVLRRLGALPQQVRHMLRQELLLLLCTPVILGLLHSTFALLDWFGTLSVTGFPADATTQRAAWLTLGALALLLITALAIYGLAVLYRYSRNLWESASQARFTLRT